MLATKHKPPCSPPSVKIDCLQATLLKGGATRALLGISCRHHTRWPQRQRSCLNGALETRAGQENLRSQVECRGKLSHESPVETNRWGSRIRVLAATTTVMLCRQPLTDCDRAPLERGGPHSLARPWNMAFAASQAALRVWHAQASVGHNMP